MSDQGCSVVCGNGVRTITRDRDPPSGTNLHGGNSCEGDDMKTIDCNLLNEAEATAELQARQISMMKSCSSDCSAELPDDYEAELACNVVLSSCATCSCTSSDQYTCSDGVEGQCDQGYECHIDGHDSKCRGT